MTISLNVLRLMTMRDIVKALTALEMQRIFALIYFLFSYQQWIRTHRRGQWVRRIALSQWMLAFGKIHFVTT